MRRSIDDAADAHPAGDEEEKPPASWMVQLLDDCEACGDGELRVALTVEDLAHTIYHSLGIDADKKLMSPGDRPIDIVREGKTRKELLI